MSLFWLSFADPDRPAGSQFLGVALIEADGLEGACRRAWRAGCNPGGEVESLVIPLDEVRQEYREALARAPRDTLLTHAQLIAMELAE